MPPSPRQLAILGGHPRFARTLHVGAPNIGDRAALLARIEGALDRNWLTNNGPYVQAFEQRLCHITGARHCVVVTNATVGLQLAAHALGLHGEVIVPAFTFVATAHALLWLGIRPVFCDIDPVTHMLDPDQVEALITPATTGILGVHLWGQPCAPRRLQRIAARHGLALIFDAAHAFGCSSRDTMIGNFGQAEVFSFHATKCINALEGGAIATNDDALAARLRRQLNFGFSGLDSVDCLGTNGKMNEFSAAMGLTSLDAMQPIFAHNHANHAACRDSLADIPGVALLAQDAANRSNRHYIVIEIDARAAGLSRDDIVRALWAENVQARRYFHPGCHRMAPYATQAPGMAARLPNTDLVAARVMLLPNGTAVSEADARACCRLIGDIIADRVRVRDALHPAPHRHDLRENV
jgi:dTDP-4-amino-4,6-dideoxygalactose transaminase